MGRIYIYIKSTIYNNMLFLNFFYLFFYLVRGMMYYWQALHLQYLIEFAGDNGQFLILHSVFQTYIPRNFRCFCENLHSVRNFLNAAISEGYRPVDLSEKDKKLLEQAQALADMKFTYVVSCQVYGSQKKSKNVFDRSCYNNILNLMLTWVNTTISLNCVKVLVN